MKTLHLVVGGIVVVVVGIGTGIGLASVRNFSEQDLTSGITPALPTQVLDRHGRLITQFFAEENRELISIDELPQHLVYALLTREDRTFFRHNGFSVQGMVRAVWNLLANNYVSGGSTLTQQLAGHLYDDRTEFSVARKVRELWWAVQLEKHWTKHEILEIYLNLMYFGHGNYGVEAASQFYFGHTARDLSVAESVMLVIQLANPSLYSPIRRPKDAQQMQKTILDQMVELEYATNNEVDSAFAQYWGDYDFTRSNASSTFFERKDKAPYFSEYVRFLLENRYLLGSHDINKDGFVVHTTLDLDFQDAAERHVSDGLVRSNAIYQSNTQSRTNHGERYTAMVDLLSLAFDLPEMRVADAPRRRAATEYYRERINPVVDLVSLMFAPDETDGLYHSSRVSYANAERESKRTTVEGAAITIENGTGHILAMIGGSKFETRNQFNRATDARVEPGSSFKPLYYAAAIENRIITPATMIYDAPVIFWNENGTPYTPQNYKGEWEGPVSVRTALSRSMNVPSLRILERVGFTDALDTARRLLNIPESEMISRNLVRRYPVGLGIVEVAPIEMARAYAVFANRGVSMKPVAILSIEDQNGKIILEPAKESRLEQQRNAKNHQIISPQTAYLMTSLLQSTIESGTLRHATSVASGFDLPMAGKTGTTQNWADAWTVGFSPYFTTAIWFGFDQGGGNSLGTNQTGAVTTGPVWSRYMKEIHAGLPPKEFARPTQGLTNVRIAARSGLLPTEDYRGKIVNELFVRGTEPTQFDTLQGYEEEQKWFLVERLRDSLRSNNFRIENFEFETPTTDEPNAIDYAAIEALLNDEPDEPATAADTAATAIDSIILDTEPDESVTAATAIDSIIFDAEPEEPATAATAIDSIILDAKPDEPATAATAIDSIIFDTKSEEPATAATAIDSIILDTEPDESATAATAIDSIILDTEPDEPSPSADTAVEAIEVDSNSAPEPSDIPIQASLGDILSLDVEAVEEGEGATETPALDVEDTILLD